MSKPDKLNLKNELFRKAIHVGGMLVPFISIQSGTAAAASLVAALSVLYLASEYARLQGRTLPIISRITELAVRRSTESGQKMVVKAPLYLAIGVTASLLIFPDPVSYAAIAVVTLGDGAASIVGRRYGRHGIPGTGKTAEGSAAGFACAAAGAMLFIEPHLAVPAAAIGMAVEAVPLRRVNDNISVPLITGFSTWLLFLLWQGRVF